MRDGHGIVQDLPHLPETLLKQLSNRETSIPSGTFTNCYLDHINFIHAGRKHAILFLLKQLFLLDLTGENNWLL